MRSAAAAFAAKPSPHALEGQLTEVANECVSRAECVEVDTAGNMLEGERHVFVARKGIRRGLCRKVAAPFDTRSPIERAILAFV